MSNEAVQAILAVQKIESDISGRKGLGDEWDQIDDETREEIRTGWQNIILNAIQGAK
jgi:hypothetical protein